MTGKAYPEKISEGSVTLAFHKTEGVAPGVMFCGGFQSDMTGTKALALEAWARAEGRAFVRFDYQGHGASSGRFTEGSIGQWANDAKTVLDRLTVGPQVLVGSSMGAWIMLLVALARPERIKALVGLAAAPDFTENLIWATLTPIQQTRLQTEGALLLPSEYSNEPYPITRHLIEEGRQHLLLERPIGIDCPIRLLHGMKDSDVPWPTSVRLVERLISQDVRLSLVKDGDHRLSRDQDLALMLRTVSELLA